MSSEHENTAIVAVSASLALSFVLLKELGAYGHPAWAQGGREQEPGYRRLGEGLFRSSRQHQSSPRISRIRVTLGILSGRRALFSFLFLLFHHVRHLSRWEVAAKQNGGLWRGFFFCVNGEEDEKFAELRHRKRWGKSMVI